MESDIEWSRKSIAQTEAEKATANLLRNMEVRAWQMVNDVVDAGVGVEEIRIMATPPEVGQAEPKVWASASLTLPTGIANWYRVWSWSEFLQAWRGDNDTFVRAFLEEVEDARRSGKLKPQSGDG